MSLGISGDSKIAGNALRRNKMTFFWNVNAALVSASRFFMAFCMLEQELTGL